MGAMAGNELSDFLLQNHKSKNFGVYPEFTEGKQPDLVSKAPTASKVGSSVAKSGATNKTSLSAVKKQL